MPEARESLLLDKADIVDDLCNSVFIIIFICWFSEHSSLKPFTYPVPETRFFQAGANVYKFKIKYGNSMRHSKVENYQNFLQFFQDAIRVILGNLDDLCPFTTEHLIIFPYLNQWEKVSDLRFMRGDTFLVPYPYVCTVYVELNLLKHGALWGKFRNSRKNV
nr:membrane-anchored junction protein [Zootoca vivipara]